MRALLWAAALALASPAGDDPDSPERRKLRFEEYLANAKDQASEQQAYEEKALIREGQLDAGLRQHLVDAKQRERDWEQRKTEMVDKRTQEAHERAKKLQASRDKEDRFLEQEQEQQDRMKRSAEYHTRDALLKRDRDVAEADGFYKNSLLEVPKDVTVGPETAKVSSEFKDLDALQDDILARDKVVDAEIDKLPTSPNAWAAVPASLLQVGKKDPGDLDAEDKKETEEFEAMDAKAEEMQGYRDQMAAAASTFQKLSQQAADAVKTDDPAEPADDFKGRLEKVRKDAMATVTAPKPLSLSDQGESPDAPEFRDPAPPPADIQPASVPVTGEEVTDAFDHDLGSDPTDPMPPKDQNVDIDDPVQPESLKDVDDEAASMESQAEKAMSDSLVEKDAAPPQPPMPDADTDPEASDPVTVKHVWYPEGMGPDASLLEKRARWSPTAEQPRTGSFEDQMNEKLRVLKQKMKGRAQEMAIDVQQNLEGLKEKEHFAITAGRRKKHPVQLDGAPSPVQDDPTSAAAIFEHSDDAPAPARSRMPTMHLEQRIHLGGESAPLVQPMHLQDSLAAAISSPLEDPQDPEPGAPAPAMDTLLPDADTEPIAGAAAPVAWLERGSRKRRVFHRKRRENPFASAHTPGLSHLRELATHLQALSKKHHRSIPHLREQEQVDADVEKYFAGPSDGALERRLRERGA